MVDGLKESSELGDVSRIPTGTVLISSRAGLLEIIENPLLEACQQIYDKNIQTIFSSANPEGGYYINFELETLSGENKKVLLELGAREELLHGAEPRKESLKLVMNPLPQKIQDISDWSLGIANSLKQQSLNWGGYTIPELEGMLGGMSDEDYENQHKTEYWIDSGYFYNKERGLFYQTQELYDKSLIK